LAQYNNIYDNYDTASYNESSSQYFQTYDFYAAGEAHDEIDARFNYWGETVKSQMATGANPKNINRIYDKKDDAKKSFVNYAQWLERAFTPVPQIYDLRLPEMIGSLYLDKSNNTVNIKVNLGADLTKLISTYTLSKGAYASIDGVIQVSGITVQDFSNTVTVRVYASDSVTYSSWFINVSKSADGEPTITSGQQIAIPESFPQDTVFMKVLVTHPDSLVTFSQWKIVTGDDQQIFTIDSNSGQLSVADTSLLDAETKTYYDLFITVSDGYTTSANEKVRIDISDVNEFKPIVRANQKMLSNPYLSLPGDVLGTLIADDGDITKVLHHWQILAGDSTNRFAIDSLSGVLTIIDTMGLLSLPDSLQYLYVSVDDPDFRSDSVQVTVLFSTSYYNNYAPIVTKNQQGSTVEHASQGTVILSLEATDQDSATNLISWQLLSSTLTGVLSVSESGQVLVADSAKLDFENAQQIDLKVTAFDGLYTSTPETVKIKLTNLNDEKPVIDADQKGFVAETALLNTKIISLKATDDSVTNLTEWKIGYQQDADLFRISNKGEIRLNKANSLNYELEQKYNLYVSVNDGVHDSDSTLVVLEVQNENDEPFGLLLSDSIILENTAGDTEIGLFSTLDEDFYVTAFEYALVDGFGDTDNDDFYLINHRLRMARPFNFEEDSLLSIRVQTTDPFGGQFSKSFHIYIINVDEAPDWIELSNSTVSNVALQKTFIGLLSTQDDEGGPFTYEFAEGGVHNENYTLRGDSLFTAKDFDYASNTSHIIRMRSTDPTNQFIEVYITLLLNQEVDADNAGQLTLSNAAVSGNAISGTLVGRFLLGGFSNSIATYSLTSGLVNNDLYRISGDSLMTNSDFSYNQSIDHLVQIKTSVSDTSFLNLLQVSVQINQVPQITNQRFIVIESDTSGTFIGQIEASDPDGDSLAFNITSGNGADIFELSELGMLYLLDAEQMELNAEYDLIIQVDDGYHQNFAIITVEVDPIPLGLKAIEFNIYPNPAQGIINIKMAAFKEATIYNLSGIKIMRSTDNRIDISALSEGVYIIKLENRSGDRFSTRLIKE